MFTPSFFPSLRSGTLAAQLPSLFGDSSVFGRVFVAALTMGFIIK